MKRSDVLTTGVVLCTCSWCLGASRLYQLPSGALGYHLAILPDTTALVVGTTSFSASGQPTVFSYTNTTSSTLTLGGGPGIATCISANGQWIAGAQFVLSGANVTALHAVVWQRSAPSSPIPIPRLAPANQNTSNLALGISNNGQAVGASGVFVPGLDPIPMNGKPFIWTQSAGTQALPLGTGRSEGLAADITSDGTKVVGNVVGTSQTFPAKWVNLSLVLMGQDPTNKDATVYAVAPGGRWAVGEDGGVAVFWDTQTSNPNSVNSIGGEFFFASGRFALDNGILGGDGEFQADGAWLTPVDAPVPASFVSYWSQRTGTSFPLVIPQAVQKAANNLDDYHFVIRGPSGEPDYYCAIVVPYARPDHNHDNKVDAADLEAFEACSTGPAVPQTDSGCTWADFDHDTDVDQDDFGLFQRCYSGAGPVDLACDPGSGG